MSTIACPVCGRRITHVRRLLRLQRSARPAAPHSSPPTSPLTALLMTRATTATRVPSRSTRFPPSPARRPPRAARRATCPRPRCPSRPRRLAPREAAGARSGRRRADCGAARHRSLARRWSSTAILPFTQRPATPTATASAPSPSATPATIPYTRPGLYRIAYPTGWLAPERNDPPSSYSVSFVNPSGGASLTITLKQSPDLVDAATTDTNYLNSLASTTGTKPTNLSKPRAVTLAGQTWTEESADVAILTTAGKQYAHAVAMSVNYHGYVYTTVRLVPVPIRRPRNPPSTSPSKPASSRCSPPSPSWAERPTRWRHICG